MSDAVQSFLPPVLTTEQTAGLLQCSTKLVRELASNCKHLHRLAQQVCLLVGRPSPTPEYMPELLARAKAVTSG